MVQPARALRPTLVAVLPAAIAIVPVVAMLVQQLGNMGDDGLPQADWAVLELATRSAAAGRQLVGAYSRWGFDHPGPAMFYWMAPFYWVVGERFSGLVLGTLVMNAVCLGAVVAVVQRVFSRRAAWIAAAVVAVDAWRFGIERFRDPWNPYWVIGPLAVLMACAVAAWAQPRRWPLAVAVGAASVAIQSHLGAAAVAALCLVVAVAGTFWTWRQSGEVTNRARWITVLTPAAIAGGLLWVPPLIQQATGDPGNLTELYSYTRSGEELHSPSEVVPIVVTGLSGTPTRLGEAFGPASPYVAPLEAHTGEYLLVAATAALLAGGAIVAARRGWGTPWVLVGALPLAAALVDTVTSLTIRGDVLPYLFTPVLAVALLWWLGCALYVARGLAPFVPEDWRQRLAPALAGVAATAALLASGSQFDEGRHPAGERWEQRGTEAMVRNARRYCDSDRPVWIDGADTWTVSIPLGVALARCGADVSFTGDMAFMVGDHWSSDRRPSHAVTLCVKPDGDIRCPS